MIDRKHRSRRQLSLDEIANLLASLPDAKRPLSDKETADWATRLRQPGAENEQRLKSLLAYWCYQAESFYAAMTAPAPKLLVDKQLSRLAARLDEIRSELSELPGVVDAAIRTRFGEYDDTLIIIGTALRDIERNWDRPHRGQPSSEVSSVSTRLSSLGCSSAACFHAPARRRSGRWFGISTVAEARTTRPLPNRVGNFRVLRSILVGIL